MNKQEKENWSGALGVVLSGFFQTCQHGLEDQLWVIGRAADLHGGPLVGAAQDAVNESAETRKTVEMRYSETASLALWSLSDNSSPARDPRSFTGTTQGGEGKPWHVVLKDEVES